MIKKYVKKKITQSALHRIYIGLRQYVAQQTSKDKTDKDNDKEEIGGGSGNKIKKPTKEEMEAMLKAEDKVRMNYLHIFLMLHQN